MPQHPSADPFRSCLWRVGDTPTAPDISPFGHTIRVSHAHPEAIRAFVFFDRWSTDEALMRLGLSYGHPTSKDSPSQHHPSIRLSHEYTDRAKATLSDLTVKGPFLPAGTAVLLRDKIYLGAPMHIHDTVLFRVMFPKYIHHGLHGISRKAIRGARILQTAVDRRLGTYSVQFWERVSGRPQFIGIPDVHLIYGLVKADAEEWQRLLRPAPGRERPLPDWAATRGSLEKCHIPAVWQLYSVLASISIIAGLLVPLVWSPDFLGAAIVLTPVAIYAAWRVIYRWPMSKSRAWFAKELRG